MTFDGHYRVLLRHSKQGCTAPSCCNKTLRSEKFKKPCRRIPLTMPTMHAPELLCRWFLFALFVAGTAFGQCPCPVPSPCPAMSTPVQTSQPCATHVANSISRITLLAIQKNDPVLLALAQCLSDAYDNGKIRACLFPGVDKAASTEPNCFNFATGPAYFCPNQNDNCICINIRLFGNHPNWAFRESCG